MPHLSHHAWHTQDRKKVTARNYISRQNTIVHNGFLGPGRLRGAGRGRGVSEGGRPPVGGRFRQPARAPSTGSVNRLEDSGSESPADRPAAAGSRPGAVTVLAATEPGRTDSTVPSTGSRTQAPSRRRTVPQQLARGRVPSLYWPQQSLAALTVTPAVWVSGPGGNEPPSLSGWVWLAGLGESNFAIEAQADCRVAAETSIMIIRTDRVCKLSPTLGCTDHWRCQVTDSLSGAAGEPGSLRLAAVTV